MTSCPCFSDSSVSSSPPQRTSMHPQEPLLHHMEVHAPSQGLGPAALLWKDGRGLGHVILPLLETGAALGFALPPLRSPGALRLHGACRRSQEDSQQTGSHPQVSGFCLLPKQRGLPSTVHHLPLGCMPADHACLRTKACTVCTPLAWPLTSPLASLKLPEEGRTRFLLLVLTPL